MIPAISYMKPVKQWALANGYRFFTYSEMRKAIAAYEVFAALKN